MHFASIDILSRAIRNVLISGIGGSWRTQMDQIGGWMWEKGEEMWWATKEI